MKILAIGDFHGKFPKKLEEAAKKENIDLILSVGDYPDTDFLRNLEFKHWNEGKSFVKIIGKAKYKSVLHKTVESMNLPMGRLSSLGVPVVTIYGNSDTLNKEAHKYGLKGFEDKCKKYGIKLMKNELAALGSFTLIGFSGYRGAASKMLVKSDMKTKKSVQKFNKKWKKRLDKVFSRSRGKPTIFLAHDMPKGYFDKVDYKKSPMHGKHVGDEYFTQYLRRYQPALFLGGHMHEYQGVKKLGKTAVVNVGDGAEGKGAVIEIGEGKVKSIRFIK